MNKHRKYILFKSENKVLKENVNSLNEINLIIRPGSCKPVPPLKSYPSKLCHMTTALNDNNKAIAIARCQLSHVVSDYIRKNGHLFQNCVNLISM